MNNVFQVVGGIIAVVIFIIFCYWMFLLEKDMNWNMMYGDKATELVCEMVKPEYLKDPDVCK